MNLALEIKHWAVREAEGFQVCVKSYVLQVIVVVSAPEWTYNALVVDAPVS